MRTGDGKPLRATVPDNPHRPVALKQHAVHQTVGSDGEVQAVPTRVKVAESSTEADAIVIVRNCRTYTRSAGTIVVRTLRKAGGPTGVVEGPLGRMPRRSVGMVHKDRALCAMIVIVKVHVGLDLPEVREDLLEAPLIVTASGPGLKIFGYPSVERRGVDGTGAASDLPPGHGHRRCLRGGSGDELPIVLAGQEGEGMAGQRPQGRCTYAGVKAKLDLIGKMVKPGVVRPGFQKEHGPLWILR